MMAGGLRNHKYVLDRLSAISNPNLAEWKRPYLRLTGPDRERDVLCGASSGGCRKIVSECGPLAIAEIRKLLFSPLHEARFCALLFMIDEYRTSDRAKRDRIVSLYADASSIGKIDNWDLVDPSAPDIIGRYEFDYNSGIIRRFADGNSMWEHRIAVVSTLALIREGQLDMTFSLVKEFMDDGHDLMHKACGWMLREAGKRNLNALTGFLESHGGKMPRTMLRYAIERYPESERLRLLRESR
ncbi:MAG: DNA alkylation repair protein [Victivallaceae bacterium]|nr:DNA alkylation repair protein [Victivallaceae bacterium]